VAGFTIDILRAWLRLVTCRPAGLAARGVRATSDVLLRSSRYQQGKGSSP